MTDVLGIVFQGSKKKKYFIPQPHDIPLSVEHKRQGMFPRSITHCENE